MRERATKSKIKREKKRVKDIDLRTQRLCPHTHRQLPPQCKIFVTKIHTLECNCPPRPAVTWRVFNFLLHDHTKHTYPRTQRHLTPQPKALASTTQGICLQNSHTQTNLPTKTRRDMEGFQLFTPWSHQTHLPTHTKVFDRATKGVCLHNARHLRPKFTHSKVFACQDPLWHGGFSTFYSMITPKILSSGFFLFPAQTIVLTSPWPQHECHASPTTLEVSYRVVPGHGNWQIETAVWNWAGFFTEGLEARWQRFGHFLDDL